MVPRVAGSGTARRVVPVRHLTRQPRAGGNGGPDLTAIPSAKQLSVVVRQVTNGGGGMPAFSGTLTRQQINDVAAYVVRNITKGK